MFHLMTHAFFKALLFMAAGIVIHALAGEQDMRKMGGLRRLMPCTYCRLRRSARSRSSGIPPFAGFFSKDSILAAALDHGWYGELLWVAGMVGAFLTGLYTFRMLFIVFWGEPSPFVREHLVQAPTASTHGEGPFSMTSTVGVLAVLAVVGGFLQFANVWTPITDLARAGRAAARRGERDAGGGLVDARRRCSASPGSASRGVIYGARTAPGAAVRVGADAARAQVLLRRALRRVFYRPAVLLAHGPRAAGSSGRSSRLGA